MTVEICADNPHIEEGLKLVQQAFRDDDEPLGELLQTLASVLGQMGYRAL